MNNGHLIDTMIQQYILDRSSLDVVSTAHIASCAHCRQKAASYKLLFSEIENIAPPAFDFDLAKMVMAQIPKQRKRNLWSVVLISIVAAILIGVPIYFFQEYFQDMIAGISVIVLSLIGIIILMILVFQILDEYRKYDKQISSLDF